jgi:tetratricopeptide (TPR) repeat protein
MMREAGFTKRERIGNERVLSLLLVAAVSSCIYANTLVNEFVYDDAKQIVANRWITDVRYLGDILTNDFWGFWPERDSSSYYRPLIHIVNMMVYQVVGLSPWAYHLMNVLLHAANSVLVLLLATRLIESSDNAHSRHTPLIAALLFATHPIHSEPVAWACGMPELFFSFFYLLAFYSYAKSTDRESGSLPFLFLSLLGFVLALVSKEPAITLPVILFIYDRSFRRDRLRTTVRRLSPYLAVVGIYLVVRSVVLGGVAASVAGAPLHEWIPDVFSLFPRYLEKLFLPIDLNAYHSFSPASSVFDRSVLVGAVVSLAFAASLLLSLRKSGVIFLSLSFIIIPLLPALFIPGIGGNPFAERYLYLPSLGFVMLLALAISGIMERARHGNLAVLLIGILIAGLYSAATIARNRVWKDDYQLWSDVVRKSPDIGIPHNNLGRAYFTMGDVDKAIEHYQIALRLNPDHAEAHNNLGAAFATMNTLVEAERHFLAALRLKPTYSDAHNNLGILYGRRGDTDEAAAHFLEALKYRPDFADAHHNLGVAFLSSGLVNRAIEQFREALQLHPDALNTHLSLATAYEMTGLADEARRHRTRAQELAEE